jgi:hypothetical protein
MKSRRAVNQEAYRKRLAEKKEPEIREVDIACAVALAAISDLVKAQSSEGTQRFMNRVLTRVTSVLVDQGYEEEKAAEVLARRLSFLSKEIKGPDADPVTRKMWSPPLPSNSVFRPPENIPKVHANYDPF